MNNQVAKVNNLTIGVIGVGGAGRAHAARFMKNDNVRKVIGYDIKPINFQLIDVYYDFDKFISEVDAVSICAPDQVHYEYIIRCLGLGKHVLVEKPMVSSYTEAAKLKGVIEKHSELTFAVHHQMRYVPAFNQAKRLIDAHALGDIFYVESNYWHDMRARDTLYDDWRVKDEGQSIVFGGACHPLDLILYLTGTDCQVAEHNTYFSKNAYTKYPRSYTSATTSIRFNNGIVAKSHTNNCVVYPQFNNLILLGEEGSYIDGILYKDGKAHVTGYDGLSASSFIGRIKSRTRSAILNYLSKTTKFRLNPFTVYDHEYACRIIIDNFIDSIVYGKPVLVSYEDGRRIIKLCEAVEENYMGTFVFSRGEMMSLEKMLKAVRQQMR